MSASDSTASIAQLPAPTPSGQRSPALTSWLRIGKSPSERDRQMLSTPCSTVKNTVSPDSSASACSAGAARRCSA